MVIIMNFNFIKKYLIDKSLVSIINPLPLFESLKEYLNKGWSIALVLLFSIVQSISILNIIDPLTVILNIVNIIGVTFILAFLAKITMKLLFKNNISIKDIFTVISFAYIPLIKINILISIFKFINIHNRVFIFILKTLYVISFWISIRFYSYAISSFVNQLSRSIKAISILTQGILFLTAIIYII